MVVVLLCNARKSLSWWPVLLLRNCRRRSQSTVTAHSSTTMTQVAETWSLLDSGTASGTQRVLTTLGTRESCSWAFSYCQGKGSCLEPIRFFALNGAFCGWAVGTNPLVWFCDQESTECFLKADPPENRNLRRWWAYLAQLRLNIYRVPALKKELCDTLSRESFNDKISARSEQLSGEAIAKMDVHLDW